MNVRPGQVKSLAQILVPAALALILLWDLSRPGRPGFADAAGIPYLSLVPAAFLLSGTLYGIISTFLIAALLLLVFPALDPMGFSYSFFFAMETYGLSLPFFLMLSLVTVLTRLDRRISLDLVLRRLRGQVHENRRLQASLDNDRRVLAELEHRIKFQNDSSLLLYSQLKKMEREDFYNALNLMLETIQLYTQCSRATLWKYDREEARLLLLSFLGYPEAERPFPYRSVDETLQGWAIRNNKPYSVRMLQEYPGLVDLDDRQTIMAIPFSIENHPWGVFSIEQMPFERYNHHTETLLAIMTRVMEPSLSRLFEFEQSFARSERDSATGLPLYGMLLRSLSGQLSLASRHQGSLSLVIIEMAKAPDSMNREDLKLNLLDLVLDFEDELPDQAQLFHFKEDNQLALLVPNLDEDGTAMLCLSLLSGFARLKDTPEILIGYSCTKGPQVNDAHTMLQAAEHLLEIQKI